MEPAPPPSPRRAPPERSDPPSDRGTPSATTLLLLAGLLLFTVALSLEPLVGFAAWGSDSGEYASLTAWLLDHGSFQLHGYGGWGFGYPFFPGTFEVGGAVAAVSGADPLLALEIAVPALGALGVVPFFLLFRRLCPSDTAALLAAALTAVASPRLFVLSHAIPQTLGDLLWVASLWGLVAQRRDPRWMAPLALTSLGLVLTHHLSSYFFLVSALGLVGGLELFAPGRWSRRFPLREFLFLGGFTALLFAYWFVYAPPFARILTEGLLGSSSVLAPLGGLALVALAALLVRLRRDRFGRPSGRGDRPLWHLRWPSGRRYARDAGVLGALIFGSLAGLMLVPLPGTQDTVTLLDLAWFTPVILYVPLAAGGKGMVPASRLGPGGHLLVLAVGLSAIFALATANGEIPADRHPEYLLPPLAFIGGVVAAGGLEALRAGSAPSWKRLAVALGVSALVVANAAAAFPPPAVVAGFQEGFTASDTAMVAWMAGSLPGGASLASDHRLSDLYFYASGSPATWDNASCLFEGNNDFCAWGELQRSFLPNPPRVGPIDVVAVDGVMLSDGVALDPSLPALPMSSGAQARLHGPGFVELYDQGGQEVWWVDPGSLPAPS